MAIALPDSFTPRLQHWSLALLAFAQLMYSLDNDNFQKMNPASLG